MTSIPHRLFLGALAVMSAGMALGAEYFLDPVRGNDANPGTIDAPWASLASVAELPLTFAPGDVLVLGAGHHGSAVLRQRNSGPVLIRAAAGARVILSSLTLDAARFWTIEGLEISPEPPGPPGGSTLLKVSGADNVIRRCLIYSTRDVSTWTAEDWIRRARQGVEVGGTRQLLESNHIANINFGLFVPGDATEVTVRGNLIENFCGDGIRGIGSYCTYEGNIVKNLYKVNANHPDAFQSWSLGQGKVGQGVVLGVVLRGNYFLSYDDPTRPLRGSLHGIGCFDGFFEDWVVESNVILTNAWHGIAMYGARRCRLVNNTVVDLDPSDRELPWIKIAPHKDGSVSSDNIVRNNLVATMAIQAGSAVVDHNVRLGDPRQVFPFYAQRDLSVFAPAETLLVGTADHSPKEDFRRFSRRNGSGNSIAVGAYAIDAAEAAPAGEPTLDVPALPPR